MTSTDGSTGPDPAEDGDPDGTAVQVVTEAERSEEEATPQQAAAASPELMANSLAEYSRIWVRRVRSGESGALPVVIGLVLIVAYFQFKSSLFLSAGNLVNLITQAAFIMTLGMAEVFVLLLGEIDLSAGYNAALGATIMAWLLTSSVPWWVAVLAGLAFSAVFAGLEGVIITTLNVPSFVVTLAGYLAGFGLLIYFIDTAAPGSGGTIRLSNSIITDIEGGSLSPAAGWIVMIVAVVLAGVYMLTRDSRRRANNLAAPPVSVTILKIALMAIAGVVVVLICNTNRGVGFTVLEGVPWVVLVVLVLLVLWTTLLNRTRFGRYVYAIGGNAEAARRAGINLRRIRVVAFALCGLTAGVTGIIYTSFLGSISNNVNGGQLVLFAVAAAVIGGTSLFGGRGRMLGAVLGGLVVAVIYNGLLLLGFGAAAQNIWTAVVLLAAVTVDSLSRRGSTTR
ncbi:MAG TPA: ABC transporter permease [Streptosporangiaceae bacterium]|nr:ABC transporter permease [Streptosporangiaceae bacterium]